MQNLTTKYFCTGLTYTEYAYLKLLSWTILDQRLGDCVQVKRPSTMVPLSPWALFFNEGVQVKGACSNPQPHTPNFFQTYRDFDTKS